MGLVEQAGRNHASSLKRLPPQQTKSLDYPVIQVIFPICAQVGVTTSRVEVLGGAASFLSSPVAGDRALFLREA